MVEFSRLGFYNRIVTCATGLLVYLSSVRMLCLITFNHRVEMLCRVLYISATSLIHYSMAFAVIMVSFASFAYQVFGRTIGSYSSFLTCLESLLAAFVGAKMYRNTETEDSSLGRAFFLIFVLVMLFLMTNMLISILTDAMETVKREMSDRIGNHEFVAFVGERVKDLLGFDNVVPWNRGKILSIILFQVIVTITTYPNYRRMYTLILIQLLNRGLRQLLYNVMGQMRTCT